MECIDGCFDLLLFHFVMETAQNCSAEVRWSLPYERDIRRPERFGGICSQQVSLLWQTWDCPWNVKLSFPVCRSYYRSKLGTNSIGCALTSPSLAVSFQRLSNDQLFFILGCHLRELAHEARSSLFDQLA